MMTTLAEAYETHRTTMLKLVLKRGHSYEAAEDIVQEAAVKLLLHPPDEYKLGVLFRAAQHASIDQFRYERSRPQAAWVEGYDAPAQELGPDHQVVLAEDLQTVAEQCPIAWLFALGYTHPEMAELLGMSVPQTKSILHRWRKVASN